MEPMSLPSRERGLKYGELIIDCFAGGSLPSRERGLKSAVVFYVLWLVESLPSRERGLKSDTYIYAERKNSRSPRGSVD